MPALYIVTEKEIPGFDPYVNGKALSRASDELDLLALAASVRPLMNFFSMSPDEAAAILDEAGDEELLITAEQWFAPEEGLVTVRALLAGGDLPHGVKDDLDEFETVLETLRKHSVRWHLAVDY
jgi:hypothetical protein